MKTTTKKKQVYKKEYWENRANLSVKTTADVKETILQYASEIDLDTASFMREALNLYMNMLDGKVELTFHERPHNFFSNVRKVGQPKKEVKEV